MSSPISLKNGTINTALGAHVRSVKGIYEPLGLGRIRKIKDHQCKVEFNPTVFSRPPYRSENKILQVDEVVVCPAPLELAEAKEWDESWKFDLRQMAARFLCLNIDRDAARGRSEPWAIH